MKVKSKAERVCLVLLAAAVAVNPIASMPVLASEQPVVIEETDLNEAVLNEAAAGSMEDDLGIIMDLEEESSEESVAGLLIDVPGETVADESSTITGNENEDLPEMSLMDSDSLDLVIEEIEEVDGNAIIDAMSAATSENSGNGNEDTIGGTQTETETEKVPYGNTAVDKNTTFSGEKVTEGFDSFSAITASEQDYVKGISSIRVNNVEKELLTSGRSFLYYNQDKYATDNTNTIYFYDGKLAKGDIITIEHATKGTVELEVTGNGSEFGVTVVADETETETESESESETETESEDTTEALTVTGEKVKEGYFDEYLTIAFGQQGYAAAITGLTVDDESWNQVSSRLSLYASKAYYVDTENNKLYFDASGSGMLKTGNIITLSTADGTLMLRVSGQGDDFAVEMYDGKTGGIDGPTDGTNTLYVRLVGSFEAALTGQKDYDAISGASTNVTANKNSDVTVQAAILPNGQEPTESDWANLSDVIRVNAKETKVNLNTTDSGMAGVYSVYDSSLTLTGTPNQPGAYQISVTVVDENGRTATSNELTFHIYEGSENLIDRLSTKFAEQMSDGKYIYDMEPWAISSFGGTNETVTVPAEIKAWYGSHTSGTYGELGYAVKGEPEQTLIVPTGCNLTLVNMKVLSSVRIVVQSGATLVLTDSSIHGQIEVQSGGIFTMNYDTYSNVFQTGASINGQLILDDGAIIENALIYSNTNSLANGNEARQNVSPVVVMRGNVTVRGSVFIRGDEAPTGTDASTGKSYSGQPALRVENGTVTIAQGAVLAVYGGGRMATTSVGGSALILNNAQIAGTGKLIAVGGNGTWDDGGDAVTGNGIVSVASAYLEGGDTYQPKDDSVTAGKAAANGITVISAARNLINGERLSSTGNLSATYWNDVTTTPNLSLYEVYEASETETESEKTTESPAETESEKTTESPAETESEKTTERPAETESEKATENPTETESEKTTESPTETETETTPGETTPGESETKPSETTPSQPETTPSETTPSQPETKPSETTPAQTETTQTQTEKHTFTAALETSSYTYDGTAKKPTVTVKYDGKTLSSKHYTVTYKNNTKAGTATVTVKGTGSYAGCKATATFEIAHSFTATLKKTSYTYDGTAKKPAVTVKCDGKKLSSKNYTVTYKNNKKAGTATVTVKGKGSYASYQKTLTFTILPKKTSISGVTSSKKAAVTVKWKKNTQATGYEIRLCTSKNFKSGVVTKTVKSASKTSATITKGLKSGKTYYVQIRAYKTTTSGNVYSKWSASKTIKVKA
jgi:hypothetical protein